MRCLLDTHVLLWALGHPEVLEAKARATIGASTSIVFVSMASLWECVIKSSLGKLTLPEGFFEALPSAGYQLLSIEIAHLRAYRTLPMHHRDPFDRLLVAQAQTEGLTLLTRDEAIARYDVSVMPA